MLRYKGGVLVVKPLPLTMLPALRPLSKLGKLPPLSPFLCTGLPRGVIFRETSRGTSLEVPQEIPS